MLSLFKGHPKGIAVCFFTEMWERFSYYGMRALLIYFLTQHFLFSDGEGYLIYGAYTAMVYMMPVLGGILADQYLGPRRAVTVGAILLVLGHFGMVFEGPQAMRMATEIGQQVHRDPFYLNIFFLSLALIVTGVGFLKTNLSTMVGALYEKGDPRRDSGFTLFYMGINVGGAAAPLVCGWLGQTYGWQYGFGVAGIGMLAGLIVFLRGQSLLEGHAESRHPDRLARKVVGRLTTEHTIYLCIIPLVAVVWFLLKDQVLVGRMLSIVGIIMSVLVLHYAFTKCTKVERDQMLVCAVLIVFSLAFWSLYEQMGSSLNLFSDRVVDRIVFGYEIPASTLQALPAIYVIVLAPVFSMLWIALARKGREPTLPIKFSIGIGLVSIAFFILVLGIEVADGGQVALIFFLLNFLFLVLGEMCLSPVSLSMVTKLAPVRIMAMMMGFMMLAWSASSFVAGLLAGLAKTEVNELSSSDQELAAISASFGELFLFLALVGGGVAALLYLLSPMLAKGMHDEETGNRGWISRFYPPRFHS